MKPLPPNLPPAACGSEAGSVMAVVLMIMVLLSLGGMSAIHLSMVESFIVRNAGLYKQNFHLAEMAAMEGVREILNEENSGRLQPGAQPWIWRLRDWNEAVKNGIPDTGYAVPRAVTDKVITTVHQRGEAGADTLRYYFAGWTGEGGNSINSGKTARWFNGRVIGVYDSPRYGRAWVEIGVVKQFY